jgi:hypothetical protein
MPLQIAHTETPRFATTSNISGMDTASLLSSVLNWTPHLSNLSSFDDDGDSDTSIPSAPFLLTPGVMDVLSSVAQVAPSHG